MRAPILGADKVDKGNHAFLIIIRILERALYLDVIRHSGKHNRIMQHRPILMQILQKSL